MTDLHVGSNTLKPPFSIHPSRLFVPNGDGSYAEKVIAEGRDGSLATEASVQLLKTALDTVNSLLSTIKGLMDPVSAHDSSESAALSLILDTEGRSFVEVWVKSNGAASFTLQASRNGTDWRDVETIALAAAGEEHRGYSNAYRYLKVSTPAANNNEIEIVASR